MHGLPDRFDILQIARIQRFQDNRDVERDNRDQVDRVQDTFEKFTDVRRGEDADNVFDGEPGDADRFDDEEKQRLAAFLSAVVILGGELSCGCLCCNMNSIGICRGGPVEDDFGIGDVRYATNA